MRCLKIRDLYEYLDGGVSPERTREVEGHLRSCRRCRGAIEERRIISAAASSLPPFEVPEDFPERIMSRISRTKMRTLSWLIALVSGTSLLTLILLVWAASGRSTLELFASVSQTFWESAKNAAVLAAKLAALVSLTGRTLRSLLEAGAKGLSVLTSLFHPGFQIFIMFLALGILASLFYGMRKKFSIGD